MTNTFYPGQLQWLGLAKEITYGTPVSAPTVWVPVKNPKWSPTVTSLIDDNLRGMMGTDYAYAQGIRHDTLQYDTFLYPDSVFTHLASILGHADVVTGTASPYLHATALYNGNGTDNAQPPSFTGFLSMAGGKTMQIPGMRAVEVKISIKADSQPTLSMSWDGLPGMYISDPGNTPSTAITLPSWGTSILFGSTPLAAASDLELDYKRDTKPVLVLNGTQSPLQISAGALTVTGTVTAVWQGYQDPFQVAMLAGTTQALTAQILPASGSGQLTLQHTDVAVTKSDPSGGSSGWMEVAATIQCLMNASDALDTKMSPAKVQLTNSTATPLI